MSNIEKDNYFTLRNVDKQYYENFRLPKTLIENLPSDKNARILDIGCGFGQVLQQLVKLGYKNAKGVDISKEAVIFCKQNKLSVELITDIMEYYIEGRYEFIIMNHVLEHVEKHKIIPTLKYIRENLLNDDGSLYLAVPNAQSNTGAYWYFEDFTHNYLFTSGSLIYVLKAAGFNDIRFLDSYHFHETNLIKMIIKKFFLSLYVVNKKFWNKVTSSAYHKPSPVFYSYELICLCKK